MERFEFRLAVLAAAFYAAPIFVPPVFVPPVFAPPVYAHEGHDHGDAPKPVAVGDLPTLEASSPDFELVAIPDGAGLILYLDQTATNAPVVDATVEAAFNNQTITAVGGKDGVYRLNLPAPLPPGDHDFTFTVTTADTADLLIGALNIPVRDAAAKIPAANPPRRAPDGGLYVPKATQRLLTVRSVLAKHQEASRTVQLIGQIAPDPNGGGHIQATQAGRIEPGDDGLPYVGQWVAAGQALAYVAPAVNVVDRSGIQQQIALVEQELTIAETRLARLRKLEGSVPQREIEEAETTLKGLQRRRAALSPALTVKEPLLAPIAGIVAANNVKAGQVIDSRDQVLFEIVDPSKLMVEAIAFDPKIAHSLTAAATAATADGASLSLERVGYSITMKQQAIPVLYRILSPPPGLVLGQPVRVVAPLDGVASGIAVPRESVVRGAGGQPTVWRRDAAQRFVPHPVRYQPLDAHHILITAGIEPGARIVTEGAGLLNQVR